MLSKSQALWFFVGAGLLGFTNIGMTGECAVAGASQVYLESSGRQGWTAE